MREMSGSWILVQGPTTMEVLAQPQIVNSYGGAPGQGNFTEEEDKAILAEVLPQVLRDKLMWSLRAGDLVAYRVHLNLRSVLLRGLSLAEGEKHLSLVPGSWSAVWRDAFVLFTCCLTFRLFSPGHLAKDLSRAGQMMERSTSCFRTAFNSSTRSMKQACSRFM